MRIPKHGPTSRRVSAAIEPSRQRARFASLGSGKDGSVRSVLVLYVAFVAGGLSAAVLVAVAHG
jgi:hypothetical protein